MQYEKKYPDQMFWKKIEGFGTIAKEHKEFNNLYLHLKTHD